ncbi:MAG: hypothetical protein ACRD6W_01540 [Nitrososphaerales archaeon]
MWEGGLEDSESDHEFAQRQIAAAVDMGVNTKCYEVLRSIPVPPLHAAAPASPHDAYYQ